MGFLSFLFGPPGRDRFAKLMIAELRRQGVPGEISYDPERFALTIGGTKEHSLFLANAYADYGQVPRRLRAEVLERYASSAEEPPEPKSFDEIRPNLLPRIRERVFYEANALRFARPGEPPPPLAFRVFSEHLAAGIVIDYPTRICEEWTDPVTKWGVTFEEELEIASENLWQRSKERFEELRPGVWVSPWRDNHDASRLCLTNLIRGLRVKGDPVAMVPNRDTLLVTGSESVEGLTLLAALAEKAFEDTRAISAVPVTLDGSSWNPFHVSPDHPASATFDRLRYLTLIREHEDQKSARDEWNGKNGVDLFVASYTVYQRKGGDGLHSVGVWSEGIETLLPETDEVAFMRFSPEGKPLGDAVQAPWARVLDVVGHRMKRQETFPVRYLVEEFPTDAELARLR